MADPNEITHNFLESRQILIQDIRNGKSGFRTTRKYADLMDQFIRLLFLSAGFAECMRASQDNRLAIVGLGSYGRRELCLSSDIDLLVIHEARLVPEMETIIRRAIYPLWDAKLEVGHTILTVPESIRLAINDFRVLTAIMDGRFLLGSRSFFHLFENAFWSRIGREKSVFLRQFLVYQKERTDKYNTEGYFVEPDIKEGRGGLRDLHFMAWVARVYFKIKGLRQLKRYAVFSHFDFDKLILSESFLFKVRNHLHMLAHQKEDQVLLSFQDRLAQSLKYKSSGLSTAPERLMKDLYRHLNHIRYSHEEFLSKVLEILDPLPLNATPSGLSDEFQLIKGNIALREGSLSEEDPLIILRALHQANNLGLFLDAELIWEIRKIIAHQGKRLTGLPEAKRLFLQIILRPMNPKIIRLMLETGLMTLFLPEFKHIRNLVEFGFYHVDTVDIHCLRTVETLTHISKGVYDERWPLFSEVFHSLRHKEWPFLAALLHDIGKGYGEDHSQKGAELVRGILKRLGLTGEAHAVIPFLVAHHLLLSQISQHRDLSEEKTSVKVAQTIQEKEMLNMLFLVNVADSLSTGPMARSDWKILLLIELFFKVRRILEKGVLASPNATKKIQEEKRRVLVALKPRFSEPEILDLLDQVPSLYFLNTPPEHIRDHFLLALTMGNQKLTWKLQKLADAPVTKIILCTHDKPGLFAKMVGVLTLNNITVLETHIFTLKNGLAFDTYGVTNPLDPFREQAIWKKVMGDIHLALEDQLPLDELIHKKEAATRYAKPYGGQRAKKVRIRNEISDFFTVIEVRSKSEVELLYKLAKRMYSLGLDIRFAKFNSDAEKMSGTFYTWDALGQKIHEKNQIDSIRQDIWRILK